MNLLLGYFREIWDFLLFVGRVSALIVVLVGAIMFFVQVKVGKLTGNKLILGGVILAIVVQFFTAFPPEFVTG